MEHLKHNSNVANQKPILRLGHESRYSCHSDSFFCISDRHLLWYHWHWLKFHVRFPVFLTKFPNCDWWTAGMRQSRSGKCLVIERAALMLRDDCLPNPCLVAKSFISFACHIWAWANETTGHLHAIHALLFASSHNIVSSNSLANS